MNTSKDSELARLGRWLLVAAIGLALPGSAFAVPMIIDFEDLAAGGPGTPASVSVTTQYAAKGVTFTGPVTPVALDYSKGLSIPGFARSGTKALEQCYSQEFCTAPFAMSFATPQTRVKVWVGYRGSLVASRTVLLEAFDTGGASLGTATATLASSSTYRPVSIPLQVTVGSPAIARAVVRFLPSTLMDHLALDDLEFETSAPGPPQPPACGATQPPVVTLKAPTGGALQLNEFLLDGAITTDAPLEEAKLTVIGAGGTRALDLLARNLVSPAGSGFGPVRVNGLLFPGSNAVSVSARNCRGTTVRNASGAISFSPIPPLTRFELLGMEVTQAVQDMNNSVSLIADKRTFVRVYLRSSGPPVNGVSGTLYGCRQFGESSPALCGDPLPGIASLNAVTLDASTDLTARRRDLARSLNFELPPSWIKAGRIHLEVGNLNLAGRRWVCRVINAIIPIQRCLPSIVFMNLSTLHQSRSRCSRWATNSQVTCDIPAKKTSSFCAPGWSAPIPPAGWSRPTSPWRPASMVCRAAVESIFTSPSTRWPWRFPS